MAAKSNIEWTHMTWNPVTGCTKISQGCKNCYAERMAKRLQVMGAKRYANGFQLTFQEDMVSLPQKIKKPHIIFVNSMGDLFHQDVPLSYIQMVFDSMKKAPHHIFQVLTKRSERLKELAPHLPWPENIWMGVTVENASTRFRIDHLREVPAQTKFLSCEPLIGSIGDMDLQGIHWVIAGGESGPYARPMKKEWANEIFKQCRQQNVCFFFKQWGGVRKDLTGRTLHGRTYDEMPPLPSLHPLELQLQFA